MKEDKDYNYTVCRKCKRFQDNLLDPETNLPVFRCEEYCVYVYPETTCLNLTEHKQEYLAALDGSICCRNCYYLSEVGSPYPDLYDVDAKIPFCNKEKRDLCNINLQPEWCPKRSKGFKRVE